MCLFGVVVLIYVLFETVPGVDYTDGSGDTGMLTLTISATTDNASVTITIQNDNVLEQNETIMVSVMDINDLLLIISGDGPLNITIVDDDALGKLLHFLQW